MTNPKDHDSHGFLSNRAAVGVAGLLLTLTVVTVAISKVDLGRWNFVVAMVVATLKALLVVLFFMNLRLEPVLNRVIFCSGFLFLAIFLVLTSFDVFFRGDHSIKGPIYMAVPEQGSHFKKPWISTPELVKIGKEIYNQQCYTCHGTEGLGNGIAAAALNPPPRNFHHLDEWKNGRSPAKIFKTLKEGLAPSAMASYANLPAYQRWALAHYVIGFDSAPALADSPSDFAKVGVDPNAEGSQEVEAPSIPVIRAYQLALNEIKPEDKRPLNSHLASTGLPRTKLTLTGQTEQVARLDEQDVDHSQSPELMAKASSHPKGMALFEAKCKQCHANFGQGGLKVHHSGGVPSFNAVLPAFNLSMSSLKSQESFNQVLVRGWPGGVMPTYGDLSSDELQDLYIWVKELANYIASVKSYQKE